MGIFQYLLDRNERENQKDALAQFARSQFGDNSPLIALANGDPDTFRAIAAQQLDPKTQMMKTQQGALAALLGGDNGSGGTQIAPSFSEGNNGDLMPGAPVPQTLPSIQGSVSPDQGTDGLSSRQRALLAIAAPEKAIEYMINQADPQRRANLQKTMAEATTEQQKAAQPVKAKDDAQRMLDELYQYNEDLNNMGGEVNTNKSALANIGNFFANTQGLQWGDNTLIPGGQSFGRMFGTPEQAIRDKMASRVPLLTQAIKTATNMGSGQMNSNFELENFMKVFGSPTSSYQSRQDALKNLGRFFGSDNIGKQAPSSSGEVVATNPQTGEKLVLRGGQWVKP